MSDLTIEEVRDFMGRLNDSALLQENPLRVVRTEVRDITRALDMHEKLTPKHLQQNGKSPGQDAADQAGNQSSSDQRREVVQNR